MIKTKKVVLSTILFCLGALLLCFGVLALPTKQASAYTAGSSATLKNDWKDGLNYNIKTLTITNSYTIPASPVQSFDVSDTTSATPLTAYVTGNESDGYDCTIYADVETIYAPERCNSMFQGIDLDNKKTKLHTLETINFEDCWNTSHMTNIAYIFHGCEKLISLDLNNWDVNNIKELNGSFMYCRNLTSLKIENWKITNPNLHSFNALFWGCEKLTSLDLNNWDVSSVVNFTYMFTECYNLQTLKIDKWKVNSADIEAMFAGCEKLTSLDLSSWGTATNMKMMFMGIRTESGKHSTEYVAIIINLNKNTNFNGFEDEFFVKVLDAYMGVSTGYTDKQAKQAIEEQYGLDIEQAPAYMSLKSVNLSGWQINNTVETNNMFTGCYNLRTLISPATCAQEIALPVTLYDADGNEYTSLSSATNGKILTSSLPAAGFDGAELVATTSVGVVALLAVACCLIVSKKKKIKFNV